MQQICFWHGAIPDVLPILPCVCCSSWRVTAAAGEHSRFCSGVQDKGTRLTFFPRVHIVDVKVFFFTLDLFSTLMKRPAPQHNVHISFKPRLNKHNAFLCPQRVIDWGHLNTWSGGLGLALDFPIFYVLPQRES